MRPGPLSRDDAKVELNKCIEGGRLVFTNHFDQELIADALTVDEVLTACKSGVIVDSESGYEPMPAIDRGQSAYWPPLQFEVDQKDIARRPT